MFLQRVDTKTVCKTNLWLPKGMAGVGGEVNLEFGINRYLLLYIKYIK